MGKVVNKFFVLFFVSFFIIGCTSGGSAGEAIRPISGSPTEPVSPLENYKYFADLIVSEFDYNGVPEVNKYLNYDVFVKNDGNRKYSGIAYASVWIKSPSDRTRERSPIMRLTLEPKEEKRIHSGSYLPTERGDYGMTAIVVATNELRRLNNFKRITFSIEDLCGNGVCDPQESFETCPHDCVEAERINLKHRYGYPYLIQPSAQWDWKVNFTMGNGQNCKEGNICAISIYNSQQDWGNSGKNDPLYFPSQALTAEGRAGNNIASFLYNIDPKYPGKDFFNFKFFGLEADEPLTQTKLTTSVSGIPIIEYSDAQDRYHKIPLMLSLQKSKSSGSFEFDGQTIYYASQYSADSRFLDVSTQTSSDCGKVNGVCMFESIERTGDNVNLLTGSGIRVGVHTGSFIDLNGFYVKLQEILGSNEMRLTFDGNITFATSMVSTTTAPASTSDYLESWTADDGSQKYYLYYSDSNFLDRKAYRGNTVSLKGQDGVLYEYAMFADNSSDGDLYLLLDTTTIFDGRFDADLKFFGTDLAEKGWIDEPEDQSMNSAGGKNSVQYYWPNKATDFGGGVEHEFFIASLGVETGGDVYDAADPIADFDTNIYINTGTGKPPIGERQNTHLSSYAVDVSINNWFDRYFDEPRGKVDPAMIQFALDERTDTVNNPSAGYSDQGTKYELSSGEVRINVPDKVRRGILQVSTENASKTYKTGETARANDLNFTEGQKEALITLSDSGLPDLINEQVTITIDGVNYTRTFKEVIGGEFDFEFDTDAGGGVADLEGYIKTDDMNYTIVLGSGIPIDFIDDGDDQIIIPFFGEHWKVISTKADNVILHKINAGPPPIPGSPCAKCIASECTVGICNASSECISETGQNLGTCPLYCEAPCPGPTCDPPCNTSANSCYDYECVRGVCVVADYECGESTYCFDRGCEYWATGAECSDDSFDADCRCSSDETPEHTTCDNQRTPCTMTYCSSVNSSCREYDDCNYSNACKHEVCIDRGLPREACVWKIDQTCRGIDDGDPCTLDLAACSSCSFQDSYCRDEDRVAGWTCNKLRCNRNTYSGCIADETQPDGYRCIE